MNRTFSTDIVILGGGIAGLWLLNRLRQRGFNAVLLEKTSLGGGQTIASQGIIHGGLKYALNGVLSPASSAIAAMPEHWRRCLLGQGDVDLRGCRVLSPHYYMWSSGGYRSRLKTFLGSKALRGRIDALDERDYPDFFRGHEISGALYRLSDFVVDTPSLIALLAEPHRDRILHIDTENMQMALAEDGRLDSITLQSHSGTLSLKAQRFVLCAGEGNGPLLQELGITQPEMQIRPLHMLAARVPHAHPAYVHCIGDSFGMTPRLTVTCHPDPVSDGSSWIWYIGGEIAESGMQRSADEQQAEGQRQLGEAFPWVDFGSAQWSSFFINRAEPCLPNLQRPDNAFVSAKQNLLVTWPTKLTLTPDLSDSVCAELERQNVQPQAAPAANAEASDTLSSCFDFPDVAKPRWEHLFTGA